LPTIPIDVSPRRGPTKGGTELIITGSNFTDSGEIACRFVDKIVKAKRINSAEIRCIAPPWPQEEKDIDLGIQVFKGIDYAATLYTYYELAQVKTVMPSCGPLSGFTQLAVTGAKFEEYEKGDLECAFKQEDSSNFFVDGGKQPFILTHATLVNETFLRCDTPSLLNKQGYAVEADNAWFDVYVTKDGGNELSETSGRFEYYSDPFIYDIMPALGPVTGGTVVTINGTGFDQNTTCGIFVRLGIVEFKPDKITNDSLVFIAPHSNFPGTAAVTVSLNGQQFTQ